MRIDVHTHIFPPDIVRDRTRYTQGEPVFKLLYDSPKARIVSSEGLLEGMDRDGIDRAVVFGFPWENTELSRWHNDYVLESAARHHPRLIPLGCVNPLSDGAVEEARRCLSNGAGGLGEIAIYGSCEKSRALEAFEGLVSSCRASQGLLLVHANEPVGHMYPGKAPLGLDFYYELARLASGMPLIFAHWGGGLCFFESLKKEAPEVLSQVYYDTAASPFLYRPSIYRLALQIVGKEKILFGSDYPLLAPGRYTAELEEASLSSDEIDHILGRNAERIFQIHE